jgi:bacterioferritin-associated ferredoxin
MILCLCNALTDTRIDAAIEQGARRPRDVYARCGCRARCGRCTASILAALRTRGAKPSLPHKQER